jgi:hypothetical protein
LFLISILCLLFYPLIKQLLYCEIKENKIVELYQLILSIIVSITATALFLKKNRDHAADYLIQDLEILEYSCYKKIRTTLVNPTPFDRKIDFAFLIITKEDTDILDEIKNNMNKSFCSTNKLNKLKYHGALINENFAFIPLSYYTSENIKVGNEKLIFEVGIATNFINKSGQNNSEVKNVSKFYNVRFFVFRPETDLNSYHRSVSAVFATPFNLQYTFSSLQPK